MDKEPVRREQQVFNITSAAPSQSEELGKRQLHYAISMGIRTVCFVLAVLVWNSVQWLSWVLIVAAAILPYTSVVLANAGVRRKGAGPSPFGQEPRTALPSGDDHE